MKRSLLPLPVDQPPQAAAGSLDGRENGGLRGSRGDRAATALCERIIGVIEDSKEEVEDGPSERLVALVGQVGCTRVEHDGEDSGDEGNPCDDRT
jgi:hypothetical protein